MKKIHLPVLLLAGFFLQGSIALERLGIPDKELYPKISQDSGSKTAIDHSAWDAFLARYTAKDDQGVVRVDYGNVTKADRQALERYLALLGDVDYTQYTRDAQLAYWVNMYNALTVKVIVDHYPLESIREIKDGFFDVGPWDEKRITLGDVALSLHNIENGIVRPLWDDVPETHYMLNCAAAGCPNLAQVAYTADNLSEAIKQAAHDFVNSPRGVFVREDNTIVVSKIFGWYFEDFGDRISTLKAHLDQYANPELKPILAKVRNFNDYFYDWSLNDTARPNSLALPQ